MPQKFFFGASTSSHQVEGGTHNDWSEWEKENAERLVAEAKKRHELNPWEAHLMARHLTPLQIENYLSGNACDHYHRFREDFDIAKALGHNAHRFSIEWSRVEPEEGKFDEKELAHYLEVARALRERGLEPFLTLWHFTLPVWLAEKGGTQSRKFPELFARYAGRLARELKGEVKYWITVNEPEIYSNNAYLAGRWPPQETNFFRALRSMGQCIRAHQAAYREIKKELPGAQIGSAVNLAFFDIEKGLVNHFLKFIGERLWNSYFLSRAYDSLDFIGVNYYFHNHIDWGWNKNANLQVSDFGWEIYPQGIYHVMKSLDRYHLPIYITENGIADARDVNRELFLREHLHWLRRAVDEGVDVRGYFHWSLLDNFEWDSGFWPCFGLVEVDYKTQKRTIRPSALAYKEMIDEWHKRDEEQENDEG